MNLKIDEQDELTIDHSQNIKTISWLNWIERWSTKPKVEGSSPSGITKYNLIAQLDRALVYDTKG